MPKSMQSTVKVALELGVSPRKVRGWIDSGELLAFDLVSRPGQRPRYRIRTEDL
jgi:hypothetical protein